MTYQELVDELAYIVNDACCMASDGATEYIIVSSEKSIAESIAKILKAFRELMPDEDTENH